MISSELLYLGFLGVWPTATHRCEVSWTTIKRGRRRVWFCGGLHIPNFTNRIDISRNTSGEEKHRLHHSATEVPPNQTHDCTISISDVQAGGGRVLTLGQCADKSTAFRRLFFPYSAAQGKMFVVVFQRPWSNACGQVVLFLDPQYTYLPRGVSEWFIQTTFSWPAAICIWFRGFFFL